MLKRLETVLSMANVVYDLMTRNRQDVVNKSFPVAKELWEILAKSDVSRTSKQKTRLYFSRDLREVKASR